MASLLGAVNFIATTIDMRAPGMTLMRMPLTVWAWFVTAILSLLAFSVLLAGGILLLLDRSAGTSFFCRRDLVVNGQLQGSQRRLAAALAAPVLVFRPPRGVHRDSAGHGSGLERAGEFFAQAGVRISRDGAGDVRYRLPRFSGLGPSHVRQRNEPLFGFSFSVLTMSIGVPSAIKTFNWLGTLWGGKIQFERRCSSPWDSFPCSSPAAFRGFFSRSRRWTTCCTQPITWSRIFTW